MRYRIALCGFSEFEHRAMQFSFAHPAAFGESGFDVVDALADADFAVVDADSAPAVDGVMQAGRVGQSVFVGADAPVGAASHLPRPIDTNRILRTLDELTGHKRKDKAKEARPKLGAPSMWDLPTLDDVVATELPTYDPEAITEPMPLAPEATIAPPYEPPAPSPAELQSAAKTAARAAARRARLATAAEGASAVEQSRDVLVLDADPVASGELCGLLERFGFHPWPVSTLAGVAAEIKTRTFAAMFLAMPLDADGIALLGEIHRLPVAEGRNAAVIFMVASQLHPSDRVRAALAGVGEPLVKPLQRGAVARALENNSIALPADARRT
jgi:ActR/RegA family two-component response regulator